MLQKVIYRNLFFFILLGCFICNKIHCQKQTNLKANDTRILIVFDASQSMAGYWEKNKKIVIARNTLSKIIDSLQYLNNVSFALRLYGHQSPVPPQDCSDTKLEVPFSKNNASEIKQKLNFVIPKGTTPIANSLRLAAYDFPPEEGNCKNIIILITDGIEACEGDPCAVSREIQSMGIVLKPFVIGIGIDEGFEETFDCIGHYYNVNHEEQFDDIMEGVITHALNSTTAQVNLLDNQGHPTETNVNMTFSDQFSGKIRYNFIHTMNRKDVPDTLFLDHLSTYKLTVHTIPSVSEENIKLLDGQHTVISASVPQGSLSLVTKEGDYYRDQIALIKKAGEKQTLNVQYFYQEERYIVGKYDIEIPVIPRIYKNNVDIKPNILTTIDIPQPGLLSLLKISPGFGSIYLIKGNTHEERVCNINPNVKNETIIIQPGKYRIVFRERDSQQTINTINQTFEIESGVSKSIKLY